MSELVSDTAVADTQLVRLQLNGQWVTEQVAPRTHLGDFLRDQCHKTGTHLACEQGVCGACNVMLDDKPVRSCIIFAVACDQKSVQTIEGFDDDPWMAKLRDAFAREHGLQCGFCTPGMLLTAYDIVHRLPDADETQIRYELSGNLCRCTGYQGIVRAVQLVLADLKVNPIEAPATSDGPIIANPSRSAPPMPTFDPSGQDAEAEQTQPRGAGADTSGSAELDNGWTRQQDSFEVAHSGADVWSAMRDVETMASCLPGAEIDDNDGHKVNGRIRVKFGPIRAAFAGSATLELDDANRSGVLRGEGNDSISKSLARGNIQYDLVAGNAQSTRVKITLDYMLQGTLAQFSHSGLVNEFVSHMIGDFGHNLTQVLSGNTESVEASSSNMSVMKIFFNIIWSRLKRLFKHD